MRILVMMRLVLLLTTIVSLTRGASPPRRAPAPISATGADPRITFPDLLSGRYQHSTSAAPTRPGSMYNFWMSRPFHSDGRPIFGLGQPPPVWAGELDRALADFGGFHARAYRSPDLISVTRHPSRLNEVVIDPPSQDLVDWVKGIDQTHRTFGSSAVAQVAYGYDVPPLDVKGKRRWFGLRKAKAPEAVAWDRIHAAEPVRVTRTTNWQDLRIKLKKHRFLRFTSDGGMSLGVRARPDGRIQRQIRGALEGVPHFAA
ncbi:hypothetical protein PSEUBRA_002380 [Kalmanozyma brasiliensis GHG001]|uniref:uncharacterized protein n=1 Tax=Kalmanozyma brasiliensis (strain GHG001) TaxID=1365824 RepID=UPI001CE8564B|nr:uncharacterized protein PSEUBRA_002380 [Kalmanozyma brasiliensis GHG001]KAF6767079.1 hypothetical protein PSEUBRA_002380 [Kalmanozyma brasiliensis GHG001]